MNEIRFRTKSPGVGLYWVQENISGVVLLYVGR